MKTDELIISMTTLDIFDFDGTLFRSPVPNPSIWSKDFINKLKERPSKNGLGWYQQLITLSPPFVPDLPDHRCFNREVLDAVNDSMKANNTTVLLTGRNEIYRRRIETIVASANLIFDHIGLKATPDEDTLSFKQNYIRSLIKDSKPAKITLWDDRYSQLKDISGFIKQEYPNIELITFLIKDGESYLSMQQEIDLVRILCSLQQ